MVATGPQRIPQQRGEGSRWYALHTMSHHEAKVATYVGALGIEVFLPDYASKRAWHDRVKILRLPMFPGYCFARFHRKLPASALGAPGLLQVVGFGDGPVPIPDQEIESVRKIVESGRNVCGCPLLTRGKRVRMRSGPLVGLEGRVEKIKSGFRFVISMDLLCRSVAVEVDPEALEVLTQVSVLRKRNRQVFFRVSEEEFDAMQMACVGTNTRCISELARAAVLQVLSDGSLQPLAPGVGALPSNLNTRMEKVEALLGLLVDEVREIGKSLGSSAHSA